MLQNKKIALCMGVFAIGMIGLAILGGWRAYSPVPFWDMWAIPTFYLDVENGNYATWWAQHNEHRIVLARILFWLDYRFFGGVSAFLIICHYCIVGAATYVFWRILHLGTLLRKEDCDPSLRLILFSFIAVWLFLWTQAENFTWAFQSQFFLAQVLPLCGFFWLAKSTMSAHPRIAFGMACVFGVLSIGTMANGVLALPLMCVCALVLRQGVSRVGILLFLSISVNFLYFYHYHAPDYHGHLLVELQKNPIRVLQYLLVYIGSPFAHLVGKGEFGKMVAEVAASVLVLCSSIIFLKIWRTPKVFATQIALLSYIAYILGTAFGTAGGRLIFGVDQALAGRYTTPAIMAWAAFFILLYLRDYFFTQGKIKKSVCIGMILLSILMLVRQIKVFDPMEDAHSEAKVAVLALALDIYDNAYIGKISPQITSTFQVANISYDKKLSLFGKYPYLGLREMLFTSFSAPSAKCIGHLDLVEPIVENARFVRVQGWMFDPNTHAVPKLIRFVDTAGKIVGFALSGTPRSDVKAAVDKKAGLAGFVGYLLRTAQKGITAVGDKPACSIKF